MINAMEARRKTALRGVYKEYMDTIESRINDSIESGLYYAVIDYSDEPDKELIQMLTEELTALEYTVECIPPDPSSTAMYDLLFHMTISWE